MKRREIIENLKAQIEAEEKIVMETKQGDPAGTWSAGKVEGLQFALDLIAKRKV